MGVYIPDMEMPKRGHTVTLTITGGGEAVVRYYDCKPQLTVPIVYKAVPVSPHGRLIDADAFEKDNSYFWGRDFINTKYEDCLCDLVNAAPTIIPADPAKEREG